MTEYTPISIIVEQLWVAKGGDWLSRPKAILQEVSFSVEPGTFLGIVGPNGAGKTTLVKALVGERPAHGRILLHLGEGVPEKHENLYDNPEYWLRQIGYVPVDNVLHEDLTVFQALMHVGQLRLPHLTPAQVHEKITQVTTDLGFSVDDPRFEQLIKTLSSGERKKINIAAELLTDPPLLLLDEPTSNLDPNAEIDLMDTLASLSGQNTGGNGPTIVLITHTLDTIDRCGQVIFIQNSCLEEDGLPSEVLARLERKMQAEGGGLSDSDNDFYRWGRVFDHFQTEDKRANRDRHIPTPPSYPVAPRREAVSYSFWQQFRILFRRYFLLKLNDPGGIALMLFSGFVAGFMMLIAPATIFLESDDASAIRQTVVLYTILVIIMGTFGSHREVSKEFRIYLYERAKGLNPLSYILSKLTWLAVVVGVMTSLIILALTGMPISRNAALGIGAVLLVIGFLTTVFSSSSLRRKVQRLLQFTFIALPLVAAYFLQLQHKELPDYPISPTSVEIYIIISLILTCIAAVILGILMSAASGTNNDRATQLAIGGIIINVILAFSMLIVANDNVQRFFNVLEPFGASYWGYRGYSSSLGMYCWAGAYQMENYNSTGHLLMAWLLLVAHIVAGVGLAVLALRLQETWLTRTRVLRSMLTKESAAIVLAFVVMVSWGLFLSEQSKDYFGLTYFDRLYGGTRYASVQNIEDTTMLQDWIGKYSQSYCVQAPPAE